MRSFHPSSGEAQHSQCCITWIPLLYACVARKILSSLRDLPCDKPVQDIKVVVEARKKNPKTPKNKRKLPFPFLSFNLVKTQLSHFNLIMLDYLFLSFNQNYSEEIDS